MANKLDKKEESNSKSLGVIAKELKVTPTNLKKALVTLGILNQDNTPRKAEFVKDQYEVENEGIWFLYDKEKVVDAFLLSIGEAPKYKIICDPDENVNIRTSQMSILTIVSERYKEEASSLYPITYEMIYTTNFANINIEDVFFLINDEAKRMSEGLDETNQKKLFSALAFIQSKLKEG